MNEEKELQANLIQAIQFSRPNDSLIAQLKLFAQETDSASHQRRLEILNGSLHFSKLYNILSQSINRSLLMYYSYQTLVCVYC